MQWLLAEMARERKDAKAHQARLLAAMGTYPEKDVASPMRFSQYQHIANRYAWALMEAKSFRKATSWLTAQLAKERPFRYVYVDDWTSRLDEKELDQLKDALRKAYKKRKKRFKDLGPEIDGFVAALR